MPKEFEKTSMSLLGRARSNDEDAWNQLVHLYGPLVQKWCRTSGLNEDDTADVFQNSFQAVARNLTKFKPSKSVASFRSWLKSIVRSKIMDHYRIVHKYGEAKGGTTAQLQIAEVEDPFVLDDDESESESEDALVIQRAMDMIRTEFEERNWNAFIAVNIDGRSATEVAEELGVGAQVIRQATYRIRRRLRLVLEDLGSRHESN